MGICQIVNKIERLNFELAYYNSAVHRFNHYTTRTPQQRVIFKYELLEYLHAYIHICARANSDTYVDTYEIILIKKLIAVQIRLFSLFMKINGGEGIL